MRARTVRQRGVDWAVLERLRSAGCSDEDGWPRIRPRAMSGFDAARPWRRGHMCASWAWLQPTWLKKESPAHSNMQATLTTVSWSGTGTNRKLRIWMGIQ